MTKAAIDYARNGVSNPRSVANDLKRGARQARIDLDPRATSVATTFVGEVRRNFDIGQNQGELLFDLGSLAVGGPYAKAVGRFADARAAATPAKYIGQGFSERAANYLAEPYPARGKGHHFAPKRWGLPKGFSDSEFNVLKPPGISRGDFYKLHRNVDESFHGAGLSKALRPESWSAKALGIEPYGLIGRLWYGSPGPLKARVGGMAAGVGGGAYDVEHREGRRDP